MNPDGPPAPSAQTVPVVHAVTSDEIISRPNFIDDACAVMRALGPRGALHLRATRLSGAKFQTLAEGLSAAQGFTGAALIINDRIDVALVTGARGVQLTSRSLNAPDARRIAPRLLLGASVHDVEDGVAAAAAGVDWLVADRLFTVGGPDAAERGFDWVRALVAAVRVPVIAIGGVRPEHVPALRRAGVHGVAAIRGIWDAANAEQAARDYLSSYDEAGFS